MKIREIITKYNPAAKVSILSEGIQSEKADTIQESSLDTISGQIDDPNRKPSRNILHTFDLENI